MHVSEPGRRPPREVLASIQAPQSPIDATPAPPGSGRILLQDWQPVVGSLEWTLAARYWQTAGLDAFVRSQVPYVINNTAWVAENAAAVFLASCANTTGPLLALELGAGLGLFARQVLDSIRDTCARTGGSEYDRLTFYVTDGSHRTVQRWLETGLFSSHQDHVVLGVCDARLANGGEVLWRGTRAAMGSTADESVGAEGAIRIPARGVQAVFANYVLDALPATILRRAAARPGDTAMDPPFEELRVRTYVSEMHRGELHRRFGIELEEVPELARSATSGLGEDAARAADRLLDALPYFEFEVGYGPVVTAAPIPQEIDRSASGRAVWNYAALGAVERILGLLTESGFLLARDLGPAEESKAADLSYVARFGPSLAFTVSFPVLDAYLERLGAVSISPRGDAERSIHTRLIRRRSGGPEPGAEDGDQARARFLELFGDDRPARADALAEEATRHINAGRYGDALGCYQEAIELCPNDWNLLGQVAQFLTQQMLRPREAIELIEQALAIQPHFSAFLWNTLGNCRFYLGEAEAAHACYLKANEVHPADAQTQLNLAYTLSAFGQLEAALEAIAKGLAHDRDERFEAALLAKQKEVVAAIHKRQQEEDHRTERRHTAFTSAR